MNAFTGKLATDKSSKKARRQVCCDDIAGAKRAARRTRRRVERLEVKRGNYYHLQGGMTGWDVS